MGQSSAAGNSPGNKTKRKKRDSLASASEPRVKITELKKKTRTLTPAEIEAEPSVQLLTPSKKSSPSSRARKPRAPRANKTPPALSHSPSERTRTANQKSLPFTESRIFIAAVFSALIAGGLWAAHRPHQPDPEITWGQTFMPLQFAGASSPFGQNRWNASSSSSSALGTSGSSSSGLESSSMGSTQKVETSSRRYRLRGSFRVSGQ